MLYIRHGNDEVPEASFTHDHLLARHGIKDIKRVTKLLVKKYGFPTIIYTSPFRRTMKTTKIMIETIKKMGGHAPKVYISNSLSRYFSKREQKKPSIASETKECKVPIYETWDDFKKRVRRHLHKMNKLYSYRRTDIWSITHALVYKQIALKYKIPIPEHIPFLHSFLLKKKSGNFYYEMNTLPGK